MLKERIVKLKNQFVTGRLDALAINPGPSLVYFTGLQFHLMERPTVFLIVQGKKPTLIYPLLEQAKLKELEIEIEPFPYQDDPSQWTRAFRAACKYLDLDGLTIGVEPNHFRFMEMDYLKQAMDHIQFVDGSDVIMQLRLQKDENEINSMRTAVKIAESALEATLSIIRGGRTEREIAAELTLQLLRNGSDTELPFTPIVAAGPNSSNPHAVPTDRILQQGDLLVIDWGATYRGYISDLTRTFVIGNVDARKKEIYELVKRANEVGREVAKPGVDAGFVDRRTRQIIEEGGYGDNFPHRTGHGIGLESHESPYIFGANKQILLPGMTFTIEPGIYLSGCSGVRIEDDIVITGVGSESLSSMPRDLISLP